MALSNSPEGRETTGAGKLAQIAAITAALAGAGCATKANDYYYDFGPQSHDARVQDAAGDTAADAADAMTSIDGTLGDQDMGIPGDMGPTADAGVDASERQDASTEVDAGADAAPDAYVLDAMVIDAGEDAAMVEADMFVEQDAMPVQDAAIEVDAAQEIEPCVVTILAIQGGTARLALRQARVGGEVVTNPAADPGTPVFNQDTLAAWTGQTPGQTARFEVDGDCVAYSAPAGEFGLGDLPPAGLQPLDLNQASIFISAPAGQGGQTTYWTQAE